MKQLFFLTAIFGLLAVANVQAQSCAGARAACCTPAEAAAKAAALDANIEQRTDRKTGEVSYVRKNVCEGSGKATYSEVE